jgi:hypothetical protein
LTPGEMGTNPMAYQPIENHGIVGNMPSAALVSLDGSVDWLCLPRFDSPSVFAALLDDDSRSSRTLPGQAYRSSHRTSARRSEGAGRPYRRAACRRKCSARSGMSTGRWRRGTTSLASRTPAAGIRTPPPAAA